MSHRSSFRFISDLWKRLSGRKTQPSERSSKGERRRNRRVGFEMLEGRALLAATDFTALVGRVFDDFNGNGFTPGEEVGQATIQLYKDNGDGAFQSSSDTLITSKTTDSTGSYRFDNLAAGNYFVKQPAQTASGHTLLEYVSPRIEITAADAAGLINGSIDSFSGTPQSVSATSPGGQKSGSSAQATSEALGGERDLYLELTSERGDLRLDVNSFVPNRLEFSAGSETRGRRVVTWDGVDNDGATLNPGGLNGYDLTKAGANSALQISIGADHADGSATIRIYSDANNWSQASIAIPSTGGSISQAVVVPFSSFNIAAGTGANFGRVGAIQMEIDGISAVDGQLDRIALVGPKLITQNFNNFEQADLSVTKTVNDTSPRIGENVTFTVTVANAGPNTATSVTLADSVPAGMDFVSATASQGTYDSSLAKWTVGTLANGANATLQLVAKANTSGIKTNVAQVSGADQFDPDSSPNNNVATEDDQASAALSPQLADLSLTKTVDNAAPNIGTNVTFTIAIANAGPSNATNVAVTDLLPSGLSFVSATTSQGTYNNSTGIWSIGSVNNGAGANLNVVARVDSPGAKINAAQITSADQPDPDSSPNNGIPSEDDQASVSLTPPVADVSITKTVDNSTPRVGDNVVFTVKLTNAGPSTATGVVVSDPIPAGLELVSASATQGSYSPATGAWTIGTVATGASATATITAKVLSTGVKVNTAQVSKMDQIDIDSTPANSIATEDDQASVSLSPPVADLSLTKTANTTTPSVGDNVTFTLTVANTGPDNATNVAVSDPLPPGLELVSSSPSQGTYSATTGIWTVGGVANGGNASLQVVAKVTAASVQTNVAQVSSSDQYDPDSTPGNNAPAEDDHASVQIAPQSIDLSLTKTVNSTTPKVGDNVTFSIGVLNSGPSAATNVTVNDLLPVGLKYVSATATQGGYDATSGVWNIGSLAVNGTASMQVVAKVEAVSPVINMAQVQSANQKDIDSTPGNSVATEDDQASVRLAPIVPTAPQGNPVPQAVTLSKKQFLAR